MKPGSGSKKKKPRNLRLLVQKDLEKKGWVVGVVERQCGPIKRDLFGVADLLAFDDHEVRLVQVTSENHRVDHGRKLLDWTFTEAGRRWMNEYPGRGLWLVTVEKDNAIRYQVL